MTNMDPGKSMPKPSVKDDPFTKRTEGVGASSTKGASSVADVAREQLNDAKDAAGTLTEEARAKATQFAGALKDKARDVAEDQIARGSDQIDGVADAIRGVADDLGKRMPAAAGYVREAAKGVEQFSSSLRNKSVDDLLDTAYHFARTQPLAFFGASVLAGFAVSRFLKSSSERRGSAGGQPSSNFAHASTRREPAWADDTNAGGNRFASGAGASSSTSTQSPGMASNRQDQMKPSRPGSF